MVFYVLFFENEKRAGEMIFMIFFVLFFTIYSFRRGCFSLPFGLYCFPLFFFLMFCALVFDPGPF